MQEAPGLSLDAAAFVILGVVFVMLLLASALFSGSEVALFSLDGTAKNVLAQAGDRASQRVLALLAQPSQLLITILILNTFANVAAAIIAAVVTVQVAVFYGWSHTLTVFLEVVVLTFVLLVVSEITPKLVATRNAMQFSRRSSALLLPLQRVLFPVANVLSWSLRGFHGRLRTQPRLSTDDLKAMAEIGEAHGTLEEEERELIHSIVEFGETSVREIMISRLDIVALPVSSTLHEALDLIRSSGHSRVPLYVEHLDNILGVVYAKDLLPFLNQNNGAARLDWTRLARPPLFVPVGKKLDDLLKEFQARRTHMALVVDEYGGTAGLVTMEDVLEEIVGDIRDEYDEPDEAWITPVDDHAYRIDARLDLDELNDLLGTEIDTETFEFETLGGLIFHLTGDIPTEGDEVTFDDLHLTVETVENHRIGHVLVRYEPAGEDARQPEDSDQA